MKLFNALLLAFVVVAGGWLLITKYGVKAQGENNQASSVKAVGEELATTPPPAFDPDAYLRGDYDTPHPGHDTAQSLTVKAAEQGIARDQYRLGEIYYYGNGVETNYAEAIKWYTKAAEQGDVDARYSLGSMYANGVGVETNYAEAIKWYTKAAEQGSVDAQRQLGLMHYLGDGVDQNYEQAIKWITMAAEQGDARAQGLLGLCYWMGDGVKQDYVQGIKWLTMAAEQGAEDVQALLAGVYYEGEGIEQDCAESIKWCRKAVAQGNVLAQYILAEMYYDGKCLAEDYELAAHWYAKAATQGDADAQLRLGQLHESGLGVSEDYVEAYKWYILSSSQGNRKAKGLRDRLREKLASVQIAEAQRKSRDFKPHREQVASSDEYEAGKGQGKGSGTGFFITTDGYLLTAYHVIDEASVIMVWASDRLSTARVVRTDAVNDIALLKIDLRELDALPLVSSRDARVGLEVFTFGFPNIHLQGTEAKYTQGTISSLRGHGDDPRLFQVSVPIQPGNSGGPLIDDRGCVVGVIVAKLNEVVFARETGSLSQNVNYALKSSFALGLLESIPELNGKLLDRSPAPLTRAQVIERAEKATVMILCY